MAIIKGVEIHFCKLDPKRPSKKMNPKNPTWELQMRTTSKEIRKSWTEMNIKSKAVREDKTDEESKILYYSANLKKKSIKEDGSNAMPVEVVNGKNQAVDPNSIGNGSIANLRVFQHPYTFEGVDGIATVLMAVQLIKHVVYVAKPMEEFGEEETETVLPTASSGAGNQDDPDGEY
jgi:hypothetical protein